MTTNQSGDNKLLRLVEPFQMQCSLYAKNHGVMFRKSEQITILKVEYKSNCFKNTYHHVYIFKNKYTPTWWITINYGFC